VSYVGLYILFDTLMTFDLFRFLLYMLCQYCIIIIGDTLDVIDLEENEDRITK
jgi:hypothetical protein